MRYASGILILYVLLCSQGLSHLDYRGTSARVQISAQRVSPAFAALEDSYSQNLHYNDQTLNTKQATETILAGAPKLKKIKLPKLVIAQSSESSPVSSILKKVHASLIKSAPIVSSEIRKQSKNIARMTKNLSPKPRFGPRIFSASNNGLQDLNRPTNLTNNKTINVDGAEILIGGPISLGANSKKVKSKSKDLASVPPKNMTEAIAMLPPKYSKVIKARQQLDDIERKIKTDIKGQVVLSGGAVYPGENFHFYIERKFDGMTQERGKVDPFTGQFEIRVKEPRGSLNVELRHESGAVIAFGEHKISNIKDPSQLKDLNLKVLPTDESALIGQVMSYESFDDYEVSVNDPSKIYLDGESQSLKTDDSGEFSQDFISSGSQILMSVEHEGYWNSIELNETGQPIKPIMHSDKQMAAMLELLDAYLPQSKINSVIWGRVSHKGEALKGVKVSLQGFENYQPLYFNLRIPNPNQEETSADGFFAFVNPPEGLHLIKAKHPSLKIPMETSFVQNKHTSLANLETAPLRDVQIHSYDMFNKNYSVLANVSIPGTSSIWTLDKKATNTIKFYDRKTPMLMDIDPGQGYLNSRVFINRRRTSLNLPNVPKKWLNSILAYSKTNIMPNAGVIVGKFENIKALKVQLSQTNPETKLVYFDQKGKLVKSPQHNGGFVAVNVPEGLVTSSVLSGNKGQVHKALSMVEFNRISLVRYSNLSY